MHNEPVYEIMLILQFTAGEVCTEWLTWSQYFGIRLIFVQSLLQAFVYNALAVSYTIINRPKPDVMSGCLRRERCRPRVDVRTLVSTEGLIFYRCY